MKNKKKMPLIDSEEVNQISIVEVFEDWGIELQKNGRGSYLAYCINKSHSDNNLGSFYVVEKDEKNFFHCFSCGANGGPIDAVMLIDDCDFKTALNKLATRYGLVRHEYVDPKDIPPRWDGLSYEEYRKFGLVNSSIKIPEGVDEYGEVRYKHKRFTLRELARENPELHDQLLIGKFLESVNGVATLFCLLDTGRLRNFNLFFDSSWRRSMTEAIEGYKDLLFKGLVDKEKYDSVVMSRNQLIKNRMKEQFGV